MSDEKNYVHNDHELTDNNDQRQNKVHGGEYRNGRLSQIKNHNLNGDAVPNEYISHHDQNE